MATITIELTDAQYKGLQYAAIIPEQIVDEELQQVIEPHMKPVKGHEGKYSVFPDGSVWAEGNGRNFKKGRFLKQIDSNGYKRVFLSKDGGYDRFLVHRLVAESFLDNPEDKPYVNHKNGIKDDNRVENLEWVTQSENRKHCFDSLGHKIHNRSLTDEQAIEIRARLSNGETRQELAQEYGVNQSVIKQIDLNVTYRNL